MTPVLKFFLFTYLVTWTCFVSLIALSRASASTALSGPVLYLGVFAPALVALGLTGRAEGRAGVRALLGQLVEWKVGARWYLFAAGYIVFVKLSAALIHRLALGMWPRFDGASRASLLLGVVWACWHLPLFFLPEADTFGQSFLLYLLQVTAISVAMARLYARTKGSLLLLMLMHAAVNNTKDIIPSALPGAANAFTIHASPVAWITVAVLWAAATYFLVQMRGSVHRAAG
ncbi:MAG TPA: CPBP family glutamic-type intramembrane protease [Terriglobales bacterium]|nr:CPBP family glutamic-type intramembrane protease [Terriglobales bacterium]